MGTFKIILPGNTPSLKNSKQLITIEATGKKKLVPSKTYNNWKPAALKALYETYGDFRHKSWRYPLRISFHFIRANRHAHDYINSAQGPLDLLIEAGIIEDDDTLHVIPGEFSSQHNPSAACCILTIQEWGNYERKQWIDGNYQ